MGVQDDAVAHNTLWHIGGKAADGKAADGKHGVAVRHSGGTGSGRHRERIGGGGRKVSSPSSPLWKFIFPSGSLFSPVFVGSDEY